MLIALYLVIGMACKCPVIFHVLRKLRCLPLHQFGSHKGLCLWISMCSHVSTNLYLIRFYPLFPCPALPHLHTQIAGQKLGTVLILPTLVSLRNSYGDFRYVVGCGIGSQTRSLFRLYQLPSYHLQTSM